MSFNSKILLLGEQTVLFGSQALSIPFNMYSGDWVFSDKIDERLTDLVPKLDETLINTSLFKNDCQKGLSFKSTIPQQFGLGSSGALTAAIYKSYAYNPESDIKLLQNELAKIESIFHGQSSGTDALVSYLNAAIHSKNANSSVLNKDPIDTHSFYVYLYNSSVNRSAKTYIRQFRELVDSHAFDIKETCDLVDNLIDIILSENDSDFWNQLYQLSLFQYHSLPSFIPDSVKPIWEEGLKKNSYYFKLCGAGGGGYFLVFSKNNITELFPDKLIYLNNNQ